MNVFVVLDVLRSVCPVIFVLTAFHRKYGNDADNFYVYLIRTVISVVMAVTLIILVSNQILSNKSYIGVIIWIVFAIYYAFKTFKESEKWNKDYKKSWTKKEKFSFPRKRFLFLS